MLNVVADVADFQTSHTKYTLAGIILLVIVILILDLWILPSLTALAAP